MKSPSQVFPALAARLLAGYQPPRRVKKADTCTPFQGVTGIYPAESKYNPFRCYVGDPENARVVYLGMFPTVADAQNGIRAFHAGKPMPGGTKRGQIL